MDDPWPQSASLIWPRDKSWCIATEIDFDSTLVACSEEVAATLLADGRLDAFEVRYDDDLSWYGDPSSLDRPPRDASHRNKERWRLPMYGYTLHIPAPIEVYRAMHKAVLEVVEEEGGAEGLLVHVAYPTNQGFDITEVWESKEHLDAFNRDVFPKAMARAGVPMDGSQPEPVEFTPATVMTPRAFNSDAVT